MRLSRQACTATLRRASRGACIALPALFASGGCRDATPPGRMTVTLVDPPAHVEQGALVRLSVRGDVPVAWATLDSSVVTVSADGMLWARGPGEGRIVARAAASPTLADTHTVSVGPRGSGQVFYLSGDEARVVTIDDVRDSWILRARQLAPGGGSIVHWDVHPDGTTMLLTVAAADSGRTGVYEARVDGSGAVRIAPRGEEAWYVGSTRNVLIAEYAVRLGLLEQSLFLLDHASGMRTPLWTSEPVPGSGASSLRRLARLAFLDDSTLVFAGRSEGFAPKPELDPMQWVDSLYVAPLHGIATRRRIVAPELAQSLQVTHWDGRVDHVHFWRLSAIPGERAVLVDHLRRASASLIRARVDGVGDAVSDTLQTLSGLLAEPDFLPGVATQFVAVRPSKNGADDGLVLVDLAAGSTRVLFMSARGFTMPYWRP